MTPRMCHDRLGLVLLGCITAIFLLSAYPIQILEVRDLPENSFDIQENGVVVVLDIANTGIDSLVSYVIRNGILNPRCHCSSQRTKCKCLNKHGHHWLFNAFNTTGHVCGEHADFAALTRCPIDNWFRTSGKDNRKSRQYLIMTMLRNPVDRYISEWLALTHENTFFKNEPRLFRNESVELQKKGQVCYLGKDMTDLSLEDFLNCSENGASNHQTKMLANMTFVKSLGLTGVDFQEAMLSSAKLTLKMLPFFGLFRRPNDTQKLLERMLGFKFRHHLDFEDPLLETILPITASIQRKVMTANSLDVRLLQFAKDIFQKRMNAMTEPQPNSGASHVHNHVDNFRTSYQSEVNLQSAIHHRRDVILDKTDVSGDENVLPVVGVGIRTGNVRDGSDDDGFRNINGRDGDKNNQWREISLHRPYQKDTAMEGHENRDRKLDNEMYEVDDERELVNFDEKKHIPVVAGKTGDVETMLPVYRPDVQPKSRGNQPDVDTKYSPDYLLDVEDVSLFLSRLTKHKQEHKQELQKQPQQQLLYQKSQQQQQQPEQRNVLMSHSQTGSVLEKAKLLQSGQHSGRSEQLPAFSVSENNQHKNFILNDNRKTSHTANHERKLYEKGVIKMFH